MSILRKAMVRSLVTLTQTHVGVGRAPGTVDLPIARDSFGLPYIPGSAIKGSVKSECVRMHAAECLEKNRNERCHCEWLYGWDLRLTPTGSIEPEDTFSSPVTFSDAVLLLFPAYSSEDGFVYVTSRLAVERANDLLSVANYTRRIETRRIETNNEGQIAFFNDIKARYVGKIETDSLEVLKSNGTSLAKRLLGDGKAVYVLDDKDFVNVVEAGIIRQTRVRLDFKRKTVERKALWSEEYLPEGTVFIHLNVFKPLSHDKAPPYLKDVDAVIKCHKELLAILDYVIDVGGKETIGKGLVRVVEWK